MAGPAKKPIRVTFLWADEKAVVQDHLQKHSQKMVDWGNAFFGKYGFELDVTPKPGGKAADAYPYCLAKSDGVEADVRSHQELETQILAEKAPVIAKWLPLFKELNDIDDNQVELAKTTALDALRAHIRTLPHHHPDRIAAEAEFDQRFAEFLTWTEELAKKRAEFKRLDAILLAINAKYAKQRHELDFDTPMRLALGTKILSAIGFSVAGLRTRANLDIPDERRLKIIHCRFTGPAAAAKAGSAARKNYLGSTLEGVNFNTIDGKFAWSGPYIIINTSRHEDITLAHEIVHAAGRGHIPPKAQLKDLSAHARSITQDPTGKLVVPPIVEFIDQGHFDGPPNDIINYNAIGKKPEDVILQDSDKTNLEGAFFVKPPP